MATKKKTEETVAITIPHIDIQYAHIHIVGDTPLIVHKWSEKAKKEMLDKQMKVAKTKGKDAKDPVADFIDTIYWLDGEPAEKTEEAFDEAIRNGARIGFPATAFKACAINGSFWSGVLQKKTEVKAAFHIPCEFVEIHGKITPREDMVKVGGMTKVADIRYRAQIADWWADIPIKYNAGCISLQNIANMLNLGGFACGVGEWRNEKNGVFGSFHVE